MEWRINELRSEVCRLRRDVEALRAAFEMQERRRREASLNRAYFALYFVMTATLLGALWRGFGWI
jgi:hypothetical protein